MLIDDYFVHQINFEIKYGSKTLVLMQVGSFFEFYGVNNKEEKIGDLLTITELLNIQLTRRNKAAGPCGIVKALIVRQGTMLKAVRYALALNRRLA